MNPRRYFLNYLKRGANCRIIVLKTTSEIRVIQTMRKIFWVFDFMAVFLLYYFYDKEKEKI